MSDLPVNQQHILSLIARERQSQEEKWGKQEHDDGYWALILAEEFGEVAEASLQNRSRLTKMHELIQVAAVAAAWAEQLYIEDFMDDIPF